jgi:hypothetical protein
MTDLIEQRLTEAAHRWQAEQPAAPEVPLERLEDPLPRGRVSWRPLVAAAAAVLLIGGGASVASHLARPRTTQPTTAPTHAPTTHSVAAGGPAVPWRALPPTHPHYRKNSAGQAVTPYDLVSATGHISGHVQPGDTLLFTAVLESSTDLPLDPCPDFDIAFGTSGSDQHRLNCVQVPYRDGQGRPMLPAFTNVRFEMRATVPDVQGEQKVLWTLDGPQQMPGFYGIVTVTAD